MCIFVARTHIYLHSFTHVMVKISVKMRSFLIQNLHTLDPNKMEPHLGLKMQGVSVSNPAADNKFFFFIFVGTKLMIQTIHFFLLSHQTLRKKND